LAEAEWSKCEAQNDERQNSLLANLHDYPLREIWIAQNASPSARRYLGKNFGAMAHLGVNDLAIPREAAHLRSYDGDYEAGGIVE
jgi:hypothetical protein